ncbi:hypothetical protein L3X38_023361 [Prunus dulcis]|uniref:RING-type E3 ubiquitin transferase n=1 Tax=Prunus dulcis TaxID=3755 RepID=A0AAD4Z591_PRUDU|nr:hypothetical protein L3X38_023361 [Prunus dulcis]
MVAAVEFSVQSHQIMCKNSFEFTPLSVSETDVQGLFKLEAHIRFLIARTYYFVGNSTISHRGSASNPYRRRRSLLFWLDGFWSASSGNVCMVGSLGSYYSKGHNPVQTPNVVLKLHNLMNSSSFTTLISGTLESLSKDDLNNFETVSILMLPSRNYQYTLVSDKYDNSCSGSNNYGTDDPESSMKIERFCLELSRRVQNHEFDIKYSSHCDFSKNCSPIFASNLPRFVLLKAIECSEDTRRLRVLVQFADSRRPWNQRPFVPNTTLVWEGSWDAKKNQLCVVACHFLDAADSWNNTHVGDCSTRLSLRFPAIWTIGNTSSIVGQIWSNKTVTESGYFNKITFKSPQNEFRRFLLPGQKYEYMKIDEVTKLCSRRKPRVSANDKTNIYPNPFSYDMSFDMSAKNSRGVVSWGSSVPFSVGNRFYNQHWHSVKDADSVASTEAPVSAPVSYSYNISYKISIKLLSNAKLGNTSVLNEVLLISAEGIYDETEGSLCMIGCRNLGSKSLQAPTDSVDCEIIVNFQFPPENSSGFIKEGIESKRKKSDPLYFEHLDLSSAAGYADEAERSIWRMDVEITLALVSTTLACIFGALQLFHVKNHPDVLPSISIFMLLILWAT